MSAAEPKSLQARLTQVAPELDLSFRPMFGGMIAYAEGKTFASLSNVGLALKFSGADHAAFEATGAVRLRYEADSPPSKTYLVVPAAILADDAALRHWVRLSAAQAKPRPPRKRPA